MSIPTTELPRRVVGYIRVSTTTQATQGASLDAQRAQLEHYAAALGLDLVAIDVDAGLSASTLARPGLQAALGRLDAGEATGLLVPKLDRLTRSVADLGGLLEQYFASRFDLLSVGDSIDTRTAGGRLVLNVLASVSQWEREAISERVTNTLAHLKSQGCRTGSVPYGKRIAGQRADGRTILESDPTERRTQDRAHQLRAEGRSLRAIGAALTAEGHRPKRGQDWHASSVRCLLRAA